MRPRAVSTRLALVGLLALALFGETPGAWTLAGGAVILAALVLVVTGSHA